MIHDMDEPFRSSAKRMARYYVKNTRERMVNLIKRMKMNQLAVAFSGREQVTKKDGPFRSDGN